MGAACPEGARHRIDASVAQKRRVCTIVTAA
jgi:hypothetical protein